MELGDTSVLLGRNKYTEQRNTKLDGHSMDDKRDTRMARVQTYSIFSTTLTSGKPLMKMLSEQTEPPLTQGTR